MSAVVLTLGFVGPITVFAAEAPSLGTAAPYGVASLTLANSNTGLQTIVNGSVCGTTLNVPLPMTITGTTDVPCADQVGLDQNAALNTALNNLNNQVCTDLGVAVNLNNIAVTHPTGVYTPGCYSSSGLGATSMAIVTGQTVTLDGPGVYIFRSAGALKPAANTSVVLTNGAIADKVFWAPVEATTIGANSTFVGNILDAAGITLGNSTTLLGRALAFGGTVTTDTNIISVPANLNVIKHVVNTGGGIETADAWTLTVASSNGGSGTGFAVGVESPGTLYGLYPGKQYGVTEDAGPDGYVSSSSGCSIASAVAGTTYTCTITNTYVAPGNATLYVETTVVGGAKESSEFTVHVKSGVADVDGSPQAGAETPGTPYVLAAGNYIVSEDADALYTKIIGGDCDENGNVTLGAVDKTCTIINTNIPIATPSSVVSSGSGPSFTINPLINLTKIPSPLALPSGPGTVTYTYTATNIGIYPMMGIWVKDDKCDSVNYVSGDINKNSLLGVNETWIFQCTKTVSKTETNMATVHGMAGGWDVYDIANATVVVGKSIIPPLIHVVKKPSVFTLPAGGGAVTYTYTVTNPGTAPLSGVIITDDKCTGLPGRVVGHPGDLNKNNLLESNEVWTFTCQTNITKTTTNIGTAVGHANNLIAVDLSPVTVVVSAPSLPNTGFSPKGQNIPWNIVVMAGILLLISTSFVAVFEKRKI